MKALQLMATIFLPFGLAACQWGTMNPTEFELKYGSREAAKARSYSLVRTDSLFNQAGLEKLRTTLAGPSAPKGAELYHLNIFPGYAVISYRPEGTSATVMYRYEDGDLEAWANGGTVSDAPIEIDEVPWNLIPKMIQNAPTLPGCEGFGAQFLNIYKSRGRLLVSVAMGGRAGESKSVVYDATGKVTMGCS